MRQSITATAARPAWWLALGDVLALGLFVLIGQREHELLGDGAGLRLLQNTLTFAVPWLIAAAVLGAFRSGPEVSARKFFGRSLNAWLVAGPLGLLLRAYARDLAVIPTIFMVVAMSMGGLFLLSWRALYYFVRRRRRRSALGRRAEPYRSDI
jgi:hypothetical protein